MFKRRIVEPRGIDHLVLAVRDLAAASEFYEHIGFTLTPEAQHPFGTGNRLVQLGNGFLELLSVTKPADIIEPGPGEFSFSAFNRDYIAEREGMSMIVLKTDNPNRDRKLFEMNKLRTYEPFGFERIAKRPDGSEVTVGFDTTFVTHPDLPGIPFFTCFHRHAPEDFYKPEYQHHENSAETLMSATIFAPDPVKTCKFVEGMAGDEEQIVVQTPEGYQALFPELAQPDEADGCQFVAYWIGVRDLATVRARLIEADVPFNDFPSMLEIGPDVAFGVAIVFSETEAGR